MMESVLALVGEYGLLFLGVTTALSCLALPVPVSIAMMAGGALSASDDFNLAAVFAVAQGAAILGDQAGYGIGRLGGTGVLRWFERRSGRGRLLKDAQSYADKQGGLAVFLTRWLFSPLGPYVNFVMGAMGGNWARFTVASVAGELVWVCLYVGLGYLFSANVELVAELASDASGFLAATAVAGLLGWRLWRAYRKMHDVA